VTFDWQSGALADGARCYRDGKFWLAHEHWESVWLQLQEPEKTFLQSLIQIAAAFHHLQTGNTRGAISLLKRALRRMEPYPSPFGGIDLTLLRSEAAAWLHALDSGAQPRPECSPQIFPVLHDPGETTRATRS
jgi:uncharacterized protein